MIEYTFVSAYSYLNQQSTITYPLVWFGLWCLTALSTIFQLYHSGQFPVDKDRMVVGFIIAYAISAYHH